MLQAPSCWPQAPGSSVASLSAFGLRLLRLLLGFPAGFRLGFRLRLDFNLTLALIVDLDFGSILAGFLLDFDFGLISASGFHLL